LTGLDRWILGAFAQLEAEVHQAYDAFEFHVVYQKLSQFAAVELSAIYHDVVKDRLYTDPAHSSRRRSTQTTLHRLVGGLCRMLSPILSFTADEAWEHIAGRAEASVHLTQWEPAAFALSGEERVTWEALFNIREQVLPQIETARQAKQVGKALEAKLNLKLSGAWAAVAETHRGALQELLNVSQLDVTPIVEGDLEVEVAKAEGQKCQRCWHWETTVGQQAEHPSLCHRCTEAVAVSTA
jgi:isoleucyl-tRNA synthetase